VKPAHGSPAPARSSFAGGGAHCVPGAHDAPGAADTEAAADGNAETCEEGAGFEELHALAANAAPTESRPVPDSQLIGEVLATSGAHSQHEIPR